MVQDQSRQKVWLGRREGEEEQRVGIICLLTDLQEYLLPSSQIVTAQLIQVLS